MSSSRISRGKGEWREHRETAQSKHWSHYRHWDAPQAPVPQTGIRAKFFRRSHSLLILILFLRLLDQSRQPKPKEEFAKSEHQQS